MIDLEDISCKCGNNKSIQVAGPSWALCVSGSKNGEKRVFLNFIFSVLPLHGFL